MPSFLADSNVLLDIITEDPDWFTWSSTVIQDALDQGTVVVNAVVYAEVSVRFLTIEELDEALSVELFGREPIPYSAAFLAGKCFVDYRKRGGTRTTPLPDFFIGAHAAVAGHTLITRDVARYRTYFPNLQIISP